MAASGKLFAVLGPLWMGVALVGLIVSAFFHGPNEFLSRMGIVTHLLFFWAVMLPGVLLSLVALRGVPSGS